jgi:hypothetical protein
MPVTLISMEGNSCWETYLQRNRTCTLTPFSLSWRVVISSRRLPNRRRHVHECRSRGTSRLAGTYYGRIYQEGSSRNGSSSFSTISLQGPVVAGFFSLRENHQLHRRHTEEIQRRNTPNRNKNTSATTLVMSVPLQNIHKSDTDGDQSVHEWNHKPQQ